MKSNCDNISWRTPEEGVCGLEGRVIFYVNYAKDKYSTMR